MGDVFIRMAECATIAIFVFGNKRDQLPGEFSLLFQFIQMRLLMYHGPFHVPCRMYRVPCMKLARWRAGLRGGSEADF